MGLLKSIRMDKVIFTSTNIRVTQTKSHYDYIMPSYIIECKFFMCILNSCDMCTLKEFSVNHNGECFNYKFKFDNLKEVSASIKQKEED